MRRLPPSIRHMMTVPDYPVIPESYAGIMVKLLRIYSVVDHPITLHGGENEP